MTQKQREQRFYFIVLTISLLLAAFVICNTDFTYPTLP
jgi:hypothetical protein